MVWNSMKRRTFGMRLTEKSFLLVKKPLTRYIIGLTAEVVSSVSNTAQYKYSLGILMTLKYFWKQSDLVT